MHPALRSLAAGLFAPWLLAGCEPAPEPLPPLLVDGLEAALAPGEFHHYRLEVGPEEVLEITVEQYGVDVLLRPFENGRPAAEIDSPNGTRGVEKLFVAHGDGVLPSLEIVGGAPRTGRYRVELLRRPLDAAARRRIEAERTFAAAEGMRRNDDPRSNRLGEELFRRALADFEALALTDRVADVHDRLGRLALHRSDGRAAAEAYERAVPALRRANRHSELADSLNGLGHAYRLLGRAAEALPLHQEALAFFRGIDEPEGEARSLNKVGLTFETLGRKALALEIFEAELSAWQRADRGTEQGLTYSARARLLTGMGDFEAAYADLEKALPLLTQGGRRTDVAAAWVDLGPLLYWLGQREEALSAGERAVVLCRELADPAKEATALSNLAWLELGLGRPLRAADLARQAQVAYERLDDIEGKATAGLVQGQALSALGHHTQAIEVLERVSQAFRRIHHRTGLASSSHALAKAAAHHGDLPRALTWTELALSQLEGLRGEVGTNDRRSALLAKRAEIYELAVEVLARLERHQPGVGHGWRAVAVAEQGRARSLIDSLLEAGAAEANPSGPEAPITLSAQELANQRWRDGEMWVEFSLGQHRSWLFVLSRQGLKLVELAPRRQIEEVARRAHLLLAAGDRSIGRGQTREVLAELSALLLAPWLTGPAPERLTVVPDGALSYVPFSALPLPYSAAAEPLLTASEVTYAPSLSVRARLAEAPARPSPQGFLAVVADPVFSSDDPRVIQSGNQAKPARRRLPRLPYTGREAEAIVALARPRPALLASGFEARRALVESGRLGQFRYLHFATHATIDQRIPARSGLAFSNVGPDGQEEDGFVRLPELARLRITAELVVLSACETAGGKELRGEGLVGLVQAFLASGARQVLVSLFPVDDQDASDLMQRFYLGLFREKLSPAAALRVAQRSLASEPERSAAAHWASWVLLGAPAESPAHGE